VIRRSRVRVGAKARARVAKGGPSSVHRPALPRAAWRQLVAHVLEREGRLCWWCRRPTCVPLDPHHVQKRSQGGPDSVDNVVCLGRRCHDATDAPYSRGKLVIRALGSERFCGAWVTANGKLEGQAKAAALLRMAEAALTDDRTA